jgi:hypothetical protein
MRAYALIDPEAQACGRLRGQSCDVRLGGGKMAIDGFGVVQNYRSDLCDADPLACSAIYEAMTYGALERRDLLTYRRLGVAESSCRSVKRALLDDSGQRSEMS